MKMSGKTLIVIDQGTSSTKAFLFNRDLQPLYSKKINHTVSRPKPRWVESDPSDIVHACQSLISELIRVCSSESLTPYALGMAFQRSTFLFWDKRTGEPLSPAISWQDTRAFQITDELKDHSEWIQQTTGIPFSPHFGGPKFLFSIRHDAHLASEVRAGNVFYGPLSAFVTHRLTGRALIDESIAGRSLLMNLHKMKWDLKLMDLFELPSDLLPPLSPTLADFGSVTEADSLPLICVVGDQQASLIGQGRWKVGDAAMNFGTSGSVLINSGRKPVVVLSLLSNILYSTAESHHFLLEGTINSVSSLFKWLESYLAIPHEDMRWYERCEIATKGIVIPGINGISAPYWTGEFETVIYGLGESDHPDHFVRAAMESIGLLVYDICEIIENQGGIRLSDIVASGGSSRPPLLQFIADLLAEDVWSSTGKDMTALGVAKLMAHYEWEKPLQELTGGRERKFSPAMEAIEREEKVSAWRDTLRKLDIIDR
jgi:glycerol kinase